MTTRPRRAPDFPLTLTRALLETLELRRILYVILSGSTAGDGLGFNRAFLWLQDEGGRALRGQLAIGPEDRREASRIWEAMVAERFDLARVMRLYDAFEADPRAARLARVVERVSLPLPLPEPSTGPGAESPFARLFGQVLREGQPVFGNEAPVPVPGTPLTLERYALAPLMLERQAIGVLAVDNAFNERSVDPAELHDLQTLADLAAVAVERARLYERLRRMAELDGLTGLLNRRRFDETLHEQFTESRRHGEPLSVLLLDADRFKEVNDRHGHLAGDDLLRELATIITHRIRQGDIAARYGGDELAVLLPRAAGAEALQVASFLCETVRETRFGAADELQATVSVGVATVQADHPGPGDLLADADQALYAAKAKGRDQAVLHDKSQPR